MRILIYGINFSPELTGVGKYTGEMAEWLASRGNAVHVITAPPYYPSWAIDPKFANNYARSASGSLSIVRCPLYVPTKPSGLTRLLHLTSFALSSLFPLVRAAAWKPDMVIQVVPTMFCSLQTLMFCKLTGAKSIIHIQDYEVDAMFGLSIGKLGFLKSLAEWCESQILRKFSVVSTISQGMIDMAIRKGVEAKNVVFFPNWVDLEAYKVKPCSDAFLTSIGLDSRKKIVLYSGNLGQKQGLEVALAAAKIMTTRSDVHFAIFGEGTARDRLIAQAVGDGLANVSFHPFVDSANFSALLRSVDCHLILQKEGVADAVLPSKLTNILAVGGNSVITASPHTTLGRLCSDFPGIALRVNPEDAESLVCGIEQTLTLPKPNQVARAYARKHLDMGEILTRFFSEIT